ncbi:MAG: TlpA family protein disulfide reductase [Pseudomonadales bacterium]
MFDTNNCSVRWPQSVSLNRCVLQTLLALALVACAQPDGQLRQADGREQSFNYAQWDGQWLLINYWAEWCGPCRHEIPELNRLNERPDVQVLGVNFDGLRGAKLAAVAEKMAVAFPTLLTDPGERFAVARPSVLPVTLLIGPDGALRETLRGPQTEASILSALTVDVPAAGPTPAEA